MLCVIPKTGDITKRSASHCLHQLHQRPPNTQQKQQQFDHYCYYYFHHNERKWRLRQLSLGSHVPFLTMFNWHKNLLDTSTRSSSTHLVVFTKEILSIIFAVMLLTSSCVDAEKYSPGYGHRFLNHFLRKERDVRNQSNSTSSNLTFTLPDTPSSSKDSIPTNKPAEIVDPETDSKSQLITSLISTLEKLHVISNRDQSCFRLVKILHSNEYTPSASTSSSKSSPCSQHTNNVYMYIQESSNKPYHSVDVTTSSYQNLQESSNSEKVTLLHSNCDSDPEILVQRSNVKSLTNEDKNTSSHENKRNYEYPPGLSRTQIVVISTCSGIIGMFFLIAGFLRIRNYIKRYRLERELARRPKFRSCSVALRGTTQSMEQLRRDSMSSKASHQNSLTTQGSNGSNMPGSPRLDTLNSLRPDPDTAPLLLNIRSLQPVDLNSPTDSHASLKYIDEEVTSPHRKDISFVGFSKNKKIMELGAESSRNETSSMKVRSKASSGNTEFVKASNEIGLTSPCQDEGTVNPSFSSGSISYLLEKPDTRDGGLERASSSKRSSSKRSKKNPEDVTRDYNKLSSTVSNSGKPGGAVSNSGKPGGAVSNSGKPGGPVLNSGKLGSKSDVRRDRSSYIEFAEAETQTNTRLSDRALSRINNLGNDTSLDQHRLTLAITSATSSSVSLITPDFELSKIPYKTKKQIGDKEAAYKTNMDKPAYKTNMDNVNTDFGSENNTLSETRLLLLPDSNHILSIINQENELVGTDADSTGVPCSDMFVKPNEKESNCLDNIEDYDKNKEHVKCIADCEININNLFPHVNDIEKAGSFKQHFSSEAGKTYFDCEGEDIKHENPCTSITPYIARVQNEAHSIYGCENPAVGKLNRVSNEGEKQTQISPTGGEEISVPDLQEKEESSVENLFREQTHPLFVTSRSSEQHLTVDPYENPEINTIRSREFNEDVYRISTETIKHPVKDWHKEGIKEHHVTASEAGKIATIHSPIINTLPVESAFADNEHPSIEKPESPYAVDKSLHVCLDTANENHGIDLSTVYEPSRNISEHFVEKSPTENENPRVESPDDENHVVCPADIKENHCSVYVSEVSEHLIKCPHEISEHLFENQSDGSEHPVGGPPDANELLCEGPPEVHEHHDKGTPEVSEHHDKGPPEVNEHSFLGPYEVSEQHPIDGSCEVSERPVEGSYEISEHPVEGLYEVIEHPIECSYEVSEHHIEIHSKVLDNPFKDPTRMIKHPVERPSEVSKHSIEGPTEIIDYPVEEPPLVNEHLVEGPSEVIDYPIESPSEVTKHPAEGPSELRFIEDPAATNGYSSINSPELQEQQILNLLEVNKCHTGAPIVNKYSVDGPSDVKDRSIFNPPKNNENNLLDLPKFAKHPIKGPPEGDEITMTDPPKRKSNYKFKKPSETQQSFPC